MQILIDRLKFFTLIFFMAVLVACGGGGGIINTDNDDPEDEVIDDGDVNVNGFTLSIRLYEADVSTAGFVAGNLPEENTVTSVSVVESGRVAVGVVDPSGNPAIGVRVTLTADAGAISPSGGSVLTNTNGVASASLSAGDSDAGSAGTLIASLEGFSTSLNYSIGSVDLKLGRDVDSGVYAVTDYEDGLIFSSAGILSPTGSADLEVVVVDENNDLFLSPLTISFSSACSQLATPLASVDPSVLTVNGKATATYTASGCEGSDSITATIDDVPGASASGSIQIETAAVNSIVFVSSSPQSIALKGTGGAERPELATLTFLVEDTAGNPAQGELVTFELSSSLGDISLTDDSGITNSEGEVTVGVNAGTVPTSVRVTANLDLDGDPDTINDIVSTVSDSLVVSTGLPDNNSFSLAAEILNPGGDDRDGIISMITIRSADAFNNPVPDGTVVNFTTEYGSIEASCETTEGACTVEWESQDNRSADVLPATGRVLNINQLECDLNGDGAIDGSDINNVTGIPCIFPLVDPLDPDYPGQVYGGRSTVFAYAIGEETFFDSNGNGLYDDGEIFVDLPEAFIDHNEDGVFGDEVTTGGCSSDTGGECAGWQEGGAEETFVDFDVSGTYDVGNGIYNGSLCPEESQAAGVCTRELVTVRDSVVLNAGGSTPYIGIYGIDGVVLQGSDQNVDVTTGVEADANRIIVVSDEYNGNLPAGTTVTVIALNCEILGLTNYEVPNTSSTGNLAFSVGFAANIDPVAVQTVSIIVTPPDSSGGAPVIDTFTCRDIAATP